MREWQWRNSETSLKVAVWFSSYPFKNQFCTLVFCELKCDVWVKHPHWDQTCSCERAEGELFSIRHLFQFRFCNNTFPRAVFAVLGSKVLLKLFASKCSGLGKAPVYLFSNILLG